MDTNSCFNEVQSREGCHSSQAYSLLHSELGRDIFPSHSTLGPIDPSYLLTLPLHLSEGLDILLLFPMCLPFTLLTDAEFKDGCEWGYYADDCGERWTVPSIADHIALSLKTELLVERDPSKRAWVLGFLLGHLAKLAESERRLALIGIAYLSFQLSCISLSALFRAYCDVGHTEHSA
jgi:hypothetical protein